jgi:MinD superfamily P-loop ATPase
MNIVVSSGKGGTGKTFISTNLAYSLNSKYNNVSYLDLDVEEPNGYLFFESENLIKKDIYFKVPVVDQEKCILCNKCVNECQFNALINMADTIYTFDDLCHSCKTCSYICPVNAISFKNTVTGEYYKFENLEEIKEFHYARLKIGQKNTPFVIKYVKDQKNEDLINIIDSPPGTSCPVIETVKDADVVLLVCEPTKFGLNDLSLLVEVLEKLKIERKIIINRANIGDKKLIYDFAQKKRLEIVLEIDENKNYFDLYSNKKIYAKIDNSFRENFIKMFDKIKDNI